MECHGCQVIAVVLQVKEDKARSHLAQAFRIELCCFLHPSSGPWCVCGFSVVVLCYGPANMTHKLSSACAEMILTITSCLN